MDKKTFLKALKDHIFRPDEKSADMLREIKALTHQDKLDLEKEFAKIGIQIDPPLPTTA